MVTAKDLQRGQSAGSQTRCVGQCFLLCADCTQRRSNIKVKRVQEALFMGYQLGTYST